MDVCRALLAKGADKDVNNAQQMAAWVLAQAHRHQGVQRLFTPTLSDGEFTLERIKALCDALEADAAM